MTRGGINICGLAAGLLIFGSGLAAQTTDPDPDAPIVPDSEFEAQLPPLDPDLEAPLAPIGDFDATPPASTEPPAEVVPDAPVPDDPALAEPLPPLNSFDVTPPVEAAAADDEEAPGVRYSFVVEVTFLAAVCDGR